jgi:hypothetical protein
MQIANCRLQIANFKMMKRKGVASQNPGESLGRNANCKLQILKFKMMKRGNNYMNF